MKRSSIVIAFFLLLCGFLLPLEAKTLFHDDFSDGDNWQDNWYQLGSPGLQIIQVDGHLEVQSSKGVASKQVSTITKDTFDFTNGLTFEGVLTSAGPDEVQFWVAEGDGKGNAEDDPWFTTNWIRVMLANSSIFLQRAKPGGEGFDGEGNIPMVEGTPYKISVYMKPQDCKAYVDGKQIIARKHEQNYTKGHLIFASWTSATAVKENHKIDDVFIYEGDYVAKPSISVKTEGKLTATWGSIKTQY
jgi:hypothetical protein